MINFKARNYLAMSLIFLTACQQLPTEQTQSQQATVVVEESPVATACECPEVVDVESEVQACPEVPAIVPVVPAVHPQPASPPVLKTVDDLLIIGRLENVYVLPDNVKFKARIDTGAGLTSIHATETTEFERDGEPWVKFKVPVKKQEPITIERPIERFVDIKQQTGPPQRRPVVSLSIKLGEIEEQIEITLTDRGDYVYPVLIGRNFLRDRAIVDVSRKFIIKYPK